MYGLIRVLPFPASLVSARRRAAAGRRAAARLPAAASRSSTCHS